MEDKKILTVKIPEQMHNEIMKAVAQRIAQAPASGYNKSSFVREAIQFKLQQELTPHFSPALECGVGLVFDQPQGFKGSFEESEVVDIVDAYVDRVLDDSVHYRFNLHGKEYGATMDRKPFSEAGADFLGATVQLLTLRTGNPKKPYSLKVVMNSDPEENELSEEIEERLDKLSELYKEAFAAQTNREKSVG
jgi:hypothetical protein